MSCCLVVYALVIMQFKLFHERLYLWCVCVMWWQNNHLDVITFWREIMALKLYDPHPRLLLPNRTELQQ